MVVHTQWLRFARLRDKITFYGHAMPIGLVLLPVCGGIGDTNSLLFVVANGNSVPIPRGSPPTTQ